MATYHTIMHYSRLCKTVLLFTSLYLFLPLYLTYLFLPLPTSPYFSLPLSTSFYLSTSPYLFLPLPTSPYLSLPLSTSPYLSLHLPTPLFHPNSSYLSLQPSVTHPSIPFYLIAYGLLSNIYSPGGTLAFSSLYNFHKDMVI